MYHLKEYLESSTVHGLSYISTCKSKTAKAGWLMVVALGFGCAGYLIQSSFSDWADSPVSTTITPHPVADLPFPDVTICPPKGLNHALKYDLMMTANMTLSQDQKDYFENQTRQMFSENGQTRFVETMLNLVNKENVPKVFSGIHGFPEETDKGYLLGLSGIEGSIQSPGYGQSFSPKQYRLVMGKEIHYSLEVGQVMNASSMLVLEVEVEVEFDDDMTFGRHDRYVGFAVELTWYEAESSCVKKGGHLVSVASEEESDKVQEVARLADLRSTWIGATDEIDGDLQWTDGSPWGNYLPWNPFEANSKKKGCVSVYLSEIWDSNDCQELYQYMCEFHPEKIKRKYQLNQESFGSSVHFWMKLREVPLESLQKQERMPGFRMSWRVEGVQESNMEVELGELGRGVESPGWGQPWEESWWRESHTYKVSLLMEKVVERMKAGDTLVLKVEVDRGEGDGLVGRGGFLPPYTLPDKEFILHEEKKSWHKAVETCASAGGHLASITSEEEWEIIKSLVEGNTWLGGTDSEEEGVWRWTDGSPWNFTKWGRWSGQAGRVGGDCLSTDKTSWTDGPTGGKDQPECTNRVKFICKNFVDQTIVKMKEQKFEYVPSNLFSPSLQVVFQHPALESPGNRTTTPGVSLSWHIRNSDNSTVTEELPPLPDTWKPLVEPKYPNPRLVETTMVATKARTAGISKNELIEGTMKRKGESNILCSGNIMKPCSYLFFSSWLSKITEELGLPPGSPSTFPTKEDRTVGLELYSHLVYCSRESQGAVQFVEQLLTKENPATLLLATINTIQGKSTKDPAVWRGFRDFYPVLERELGLQYGRILLAIASPAELQAVLARDWPYLDSYRQEMDACLQGDCGGVEEAMGELETSQSASLFSPHLIDSGETPHPFALIPFCAYQGNMNTLGKKASNLTMPVCSSFKRTVLDGQMCWKLEVEEGQIKSGEDNALILILDPIPITPDGGFHHNWELNFGKRFMTGSNNAERASLAKIYIPTIARFRVRQAGSFALSDLKKMTGTDNFLSKDDSKKDCSLQSYEECQTEGFLQQMEAVCGCLPWSLSPTLAHQVMTPPSHPSQATNYCTPSPASYSCYTNISTQDFGCRKSCTGLYADIAFTKDLESLSHAQVLQVVEEYQRYKDSYARNIIFDGATEKS